MDSAEHKRLLETLTSPRQSLVGKTNDEYEDDDYDEVESSRNLVLSEQETIKGLNAVDISYPTNLQYQGSIDLYGENVEKFKKAIDAETSPTRRDHNDIVEEKLQIVPDQDTTKHLYKVASKVEKRNKFLTKNGEIRSNFADVKHTAKSSILDSDDAKNSPFWGFYTPFWMAIAVSMVSGSVKTIRQVGLLNALVSSRIIQLFFSDVIWVGLSDLLLYSTIYLTFGIQLLCKHKIINWNTTGFTLQTFLEVGFLTGVLIWLQNNSYQWIANVFLILHSFVFLMKAHSYAFYNGYLWGILNELEFSRTCLLKKSKKDLSIDEKTLKESVEFCQFEIKQTSKDESKQFPKNINFKNFFLYSMFPTVVYQTEYPRTNSINKYYLFGKIMAIFGIIVVMIIVSQESVYPLIIRGISLRNLPFGDKIKEYPFLLLDLIPPFFLLYVLVFFLIWDSILNAIAELTYFADRDFYGPWWNCVTWDEFARLWNTPVHKFLLRHVYHSSISAFQLSKNQATLVTFLLSSLFHEIVMYVIFGKLRFYLFIIQMYQLPLTALSRSKFMRSRKLLGNVIFWFGIASGAALVSSLYVVF